MYILHQNKCEGATITASSENPDYDFTTAFNDDRLSRVGRTVSDTSQTIDFDLLSSVPISKLMIQNHNLTSGMTASLEGFTNNPLVDPMEMNLPLISNANDISGNGNDGTATDITWTGGVANFNGVSSKIDLLSYAMPTDEFSISFKISLSGAQSGKSIFYTKKVGGFCPFVILATDNSVIIYTSPSTGGYLLNAINGLSYNTIYNITVIYDGSTIKTYLNNTYVNQANIIINTTLPGASFGYEYEGVINYFSGTMSNFRLFNVALTDAERTNLFLYNDYFAPDYTTALTYNATYIYKDLVTDQTYRYWRLSISDASNPDDYIEISKVFLGTHLSVYMDTGMSLNNDSNSNTSKSTSGQMYGNRQLQYKSAKFVLSDIDATKRTLIKSFWNSVDIVKPFWLIIWEDSLTVEDPIYCVLTKSLSWSKVVANGNLWSVAIEIEEIK